MEKKEVIIGSPVRVAGATVVPVTQVSLYYWCGKGGVSFFGLKYPVSIVVATPEEKKAFRVTGEEIPLDQLIQEVPGMKEVIEKI